MANEIRDAGAAAWPSGSTPPDRSTIRAVFETIQIEVDKKAEKSIALQAAGLVSITSPALSGTNPTIGVVKASQSEVAAGEEDGKAITPLGLKPQVERLDGLEQAVAGKASSSSVDALATALAGKASTVSVDAVSTALSGKASTSSVAAAANIAVSARDAVAAMAPALAVKSDLATEPTRHPADNILAFARDAVGAPGAKPPVPAGWVANGPDGLPVIVLPARAALASRYGWRVADGARRLDVKLRRPHAVSDPASDGVRIAVQLLDAQRKAIGFPIDLETLLDLTPAAGSYERSFVLGPETSGAIDVPLSPSAAFAVPLIQTYGDAGVEIDVFEHRDVSLLLDLMDRVATLEENA